MVATNSMATRSSLELMLDKLQQTEDRSKDTPPALPVRPVSRARLPRPRRPLQLDLQRINCEGKNDASFNIESKGTQKQDFTHFQNKIELSENSKEIEEKGISKIQKCYRGHRVLCNYKEVRTGIIALQSFIRGENARRSYQYKRRSTLEAIILIQKQTRKFFERREHESAGIRDCVDQTDFERKSDDQTRVTYTYLVDLQRRVLRTEAKLREKKEENMALKIQLEDMEKKWGKYEERMKLMEKEWQDQFTYIQECLAAAKNNRSQNHDKFTITAGTPSGRSLDIQMNSVYQEEPVQGEDGNFSEVAYDEACLKFHPQEEVRRLKRRFKTWKKEYKNKLRDAQSTFRKIGNSKRQKSWWGRLSQ